MELERRFQTWYPFFIPLFMIFLMISSTVAAEIWVPIRTDNFFLPDGVYRSQGLTTDGQNWFFSWQYGLEKTTLGLPYSDPPYQVIARNGHFDLEKFQPTSTAIPPALVAMGSNHIGDIDYYKGKIYAPIEDHNPDDPAADYQHPYIAVYNASDLSYTGRSYLLPQSDLTEGVPWVAVDGCSDMAFTAEWNPTTKINRYQLHDFTPKGYLMLDRTLGRIQGAKVHNGALYASTDDDNKALYKIDLSNGHVDELFRLNELPAEFAGAKIEVEGLSFLDRPEGSSLQVLRIIGDEGNLSTLHAALETYVLVPTDIPAFNVKQLIIDQNRGALFLWSNFALGKDSNGINPVKEAVTLKIDGFTRMIPACSFRKNPYLPWFTFAGQIDNVWIEALIRPQGRNRFVFQALAYGTELEETNNPITVGLTIGDDRGATQVDAHAY